MLVSCGPSGSNFRLEGSFRDMQAGELYVYNLDGQDARFDTLTIQDGRFLYKGQVASTTAFIILLPNGVEQVFFASPGSDLMYEATANDLKNYVVNGSPENKLMNQFRKEAFTFDEAKTRELARTYISNHTESLVAIYLLDRYFVQNHSTSPDQLSKLIKVVKRHHPADHYLVNLEQRLKYSRQSRVGQVLPNITLTTREGKTCRLWADDATTSNTAKADTTAFDAKASKIGKQVQEQGMAKANKGKTAKVEDKAKDYNLLVFWATWPIDGYESIWKIRSCSDDYKKDGKLRVVAISLDIERYRWEETTAQDSTRTIEHYCDGLSFESKAVQQLGIEKIPSFILTDKNHKILERGNDISKLTNIVEKYMPKDQKEED